MDVHGHATSRLEEPLLGQIDDTHAARAEPFSQYKAAYLFPGAEPVGLGREGEGEGHEREHLRVFGALCTQRCQGRGPLPGASGRSCAHKSDTRAHWLSVGSLMRVVPQ